MAIREEGKSAPPAEALGRTGQDIVHSDLKRQLLRRMGLAGLMIVLLLVALAVFDRLNTPDDSLPGEAPFSEPVPVRKRELVQPLKPAETPEQAPPTVEVPAEPEASAAPVEKSGAPPSEAAASLPSRASIPTQAGGAEVQPAAGYALQSAAFSDPRAAEEVQAALAQEGIPSSTETHLWVGPFKHRADAEAARRKLKTLGIETLSLVHRGRKP